MSLKLTNDFQIDLFLQLNLIVIQMLSKCHELCSSSPPRPPPPGCRRTAPPPWLGSSHSNRGTEYFLLHNTLSLFCPDSSSCSIGHQQCWTRGEPGLELDKQVTWNIEPWSLLAHRCWRLLVCLVLLLVLVWLADTRVLVVVKALWGKQVVWGRRVPLHHEYLALSYKCSDLGDRNSQCKCRRNLGNVPECHIQGSHLKRGQYNPVTEPQLPGVLSPSYFLLCRCTVGYTLYMSCLLAEPPTHRICEDWLDHTYHIIYLHTLQPCAFGRKIGLFRGWGKCFLSCSKHL